VRNPEIVYISLIYYSS